MDLGKAEKFGNKLAKPSKPKTLSVIEHAEILGNTINHALIGATTFYVTWLAFHVGFAQSTTWHAWLTTIAYQFFMSEGMVALYNKNTYTMSIQKRKYKIRIHWVLQVIACGLALYGMIFEIYKRQQSHRRHFHSVHAVSGLVSGISLILVILSGCSALFSAELRNYIKPFFSKVSHNLLSAVCYLSGMIAIISAYYTRSWCIRNDPGEIRFIMMWLLSFVTALTMIGPVKTFYCQCQAFLQLFDSSKA